MPIMSLSVGGVEELRVVVLVRGLPVRLQRRTDVRPLEVLISVNP